MAEARLPEDPVFYMTCCRRAAITNQIEDQNVPIMLNVTQYVRPDETLHPFSGYNTRYVVDSGGYSAMDQYGGDFPWSIRDYHDWLRDAYETRRFDWAPIMDLACEAAFDDVMSVEERVDRTVDNTIRHWELDPEYPVLPVLQGRTPDQYIECYERLRDHGIPTEYVGVGTLCRLEKPTEIASVEQCIRTRTKIKAIHGFGVKVTAFKFGATFESADSQAWSWGGEIRKEIHACSVLPTQDRKGRLPRFGARI